MKFLKAIISSIKLGHWINSSSSIWRGDGQACSKDTRHCKLTVSSLVESPTQLSNAVDDIQRLPSETVRSVSSFVESLTSNTEDEIQGSHIEMEKIKREQTEKEEIQRLRRKKMKDYRCKENSALWKKEVNKLKYKLEKEPLFKIDDFKDNNADITFFTGFH